MICSVLLDLNEVRGVKGTNIMMDKARPHLNLPLPDYKPSLALRLVEAQDLHFRHDPNSHGIFASSLFNLQPSNKTPLICQPVSAQLSIDWETTLVFLLY